MLTVNRILVMLAVEILGDKSRGVTVANLIVNTTGRHENLKQSVYVTLHRLCDIGWLEQYRAGDSSPFPCYELTDKGRRELQEALDEFEQLTKIVKRVVRRVA